MDDFILATRLWFSSYWHGLNWPLRIIWLTIVTFVLWVVVAELFYYHDPIY